jgi:hypothetical protein
MNVETILKKNVSSQPASSSPLLNVTTSCEEVNGVSSQPGEEVNDVSSPPVTTGDEEVNQPKLVAVRQLVTKFRGIPIPRAYWFLAKHNNDSIKYVDKKYIFNEPLDTHILDAASNNLFMQKDRHLIEYKTALWSLSNIDRTAGRFLKVMQTLKEKFLKQLCITQYVWILGENYERENPNLVPYIRIQHWSYGFKSRNVSNRFISDYEGPGIKWINIKKRKGSDVYKVFASRYFKKNVLIGVYFGRNGFNAEKVSKYAVSSTFGVVDPPLEAENLSTIPFGMGMHYVKFTQTSESANVELNKFFCFVTTKPIMERQEIIAYCGDSVEFL